VHFDEFAEGKTFLHRIDPRTKIVCTFLFALSVAVMEKPLPLVAALLVSMGFLIASRPRWGKVASRFFVINGFILFLWIILPLTVPGRRVLSLGPLTLSREGITASLVITLRANAIYGIMLSFLGTSSVVHLVHGLHHLRLPKRIVQLFFFTFRYLTVLHGEYQRNVRVLKVRCFRPKMGLHTYRTYAYIIGMMFLKSYERSQRIYQAMLCRGYTGEFRTLDHFSFTREDGIFALGNIILLLTLYMIKGMFQ
jgi:cobalt/nickel transport system permease protein